MTVYHPQNSKLGNKWINIGFLGWNGVISGINEHQLAISQIGVEYFDESWGKASRIGNVFTYLLRDILQYDTTLDLAIDRMQKTRRTCYNLLGIGDGKAKTFRGFQYSHSALNIVSD